MDKSWFDLRPQIRRTYAKAVWVPLRISHAEQSGEYGREGFTEIFEGAHAIAVLLDVRQLGEEYNWQSDYEHRPWAERNFYKSSDIYCHDADVEVGIRLCLAQNIPDADHAVWHLHQDVAIALALHREGDIWVRPEEDYVEVVRLRRGSDGRPIAMEMRAEHLRDYLCARGAALRIASYRQRDAVLDALGDIDFPEDGALEEIEGGRLECRAWAIDSTGSPYGSTVGVFQMSRNDVDLDADVPLMGQETNDNVDSKSWSFARTGPKLWRVMSEFWRDEWVEPAENSQRVRRDRVASEVTFVVEADGTRMNADLLNDEDIGRWLWFSPNVVMSLLARRGAKLEWYTKDTGGLSTPSQPTVHFGINESGLLTVYARDVARLDEWERRFWAGFNVSPEGKVSAELLAAQVRAEVVRTKAPEAFLGAVLRQAGAAWKTRFGTELFRPHDQWNAILNRVHRFRANDLTGLLSLAKDVARLIADSIDASVAQAVAPPPNGEWRGSLKSLELALATICGEELAHRTLGPLFAVYDLRVSDAHLPRSDLLAFFALLGIAEDSTPAEKGYQLLNATVTALNQIMLILTNRYPGTPRS